MQDRRPDQPDNHGQNDSDRTPTQTEIDLALLFKTDLHVGSQPVYRQKRPSTPLNLRYEIDGDMHQRSYLSPLSWRAIVLFALTDGKTVSVYEMDQPGRYRRLFPKTLRRRLAWHARPDANFPPVARFYDPTGNAVLLLTRSRFCGHAVDVLHNLTDGGPVFQPLWISDIMALRATFGIELVRDEKFSATMPISAYLEAAAMTGRIIDEPELSGLPLSGKSRRLITPAPSKVVAGIFDQQCRENPALEKLREVSVYDDYLV